MNKLLAFILIFSLTQISVALTSDESVEVAPSSNAESQGSDAMSGYSDGPIGPVTEREEELVESRADSMGGAPNAGGGMGTGTGAGSKVGNETGEGIMGAGAPGEVEEEMYEGREE